MLGLQKINTVDVEHRARCHGLIVKHLDGWSVVYGVAFSSPLVLLTARSQFFR
jgi:hypothetical protein